ncbi:MAG TPA: sugar ABC transporter substrate-binding protein [Thermotogota bacterium]|nr:sugar ABC transporter substrate-binding protein [Thermotogota bacterium]NLH19428.1 sugar ABC transporter substrate-binding protein [Thermotogaceae bacterium]OQC29980.1 MAG: putative ABC transporter-binding protein precursor [Thermotogota bacterium ADurb.Bin062]HNW46010.1 sugar ABC transporter substrate-binding protein [Thermotogota bacterium]HNY81916.1 sugar ABC transporter substrate-binding protein [Thermotogota bacterium]
MRKAFLLGLFLLATLLSAATLEVLWMGWPKDQVMPLIEEFQKQNPGVEIDIQLVPFGQLFQTIEVRLSSGGGTPDVYIVDGPNTASYAARGYLLPLDDFFSTQEKAAWFPSSIVAGSYRGKFYSVPYGTSSAGLFFNKEIFEKYGVPLPEESLDARMTWDEVAELAKRLTIDTDNDGRPDIWGIVIEQIDRPYLLFPLAQSLGAQVLSPDGLTATGYITSEKFVEAATFYWKLFNEWKVAPQGVNDSAIAREYFGTGKAAMLLGNEWNIVRLLKYPEIRFGLSPFPIFPGGTAVTPTGSWHVGINSKTKKQELALKFVKYITGKEAVIQWYLANGVAPARPDVYEALPEIFMHPMWQMFLQEMKTTAVTRPLTPGYSQYELILREAFNSIHYGAPPKQALEDAAKKIDRELSKYK